MVQLSILQIIPSMSNMFLTENEVPHLLNTTKISTHLFTPKLSCSHCSPYISYSYSCENLVLNPAKSRDWYFFPHVSFLLEYEFELLILNGRESLNFSSLSSTVSVNVLNATPSFYPFPLSVNLPRTIIISNNPFILSRALQRAST